MTRDPSITPEQEVLIDFSWEFGDASVEREILQRAVVRLSGTAKPDFSVDELNLLRQWFHTMQDCSPGCLEQVDYDLAKKIYDRLGMPDDHPDRHPTRMTPP